MIYGSTWKDLSIFIWFHPLNDFKILENILKPAGQFEKTQHHESAILFGPLAALAWETRVHSAVSTRRAGHCLSVDETWGTSVCGTKQKAGRSKRLHKISQNLLAKLGPSMQAKWKDLTKSRFFTLCVDSTVHLHCPKLEDYQFSGIYDFQEGFSIAFVVFSMLCEHFQTCKNRCWVSRRQTIAILQLKPQEISGDSAADGVENGSEIMVWKSAKRCKTFQSCSIHLGVWLKFEPPHIDCPSQKKNKRNQRTRMQIT